MRAKRAAKQSRKSEIENLNSAAELPLEGL
jgi:hypothetical protein